MLEVYLTKWGFEPLVVANGSEAWEVFQRNDAPELAILDWMMPGMDGVFVCQGVRKINPQRCFYLILLTTKGGKQDIVAGLEAGADDYLTKPFDPDELRARLQAGKRIVELHKSLICAQRALQEQATHDALTGLLNRGASLEVFRGELNRGRREKRPLCIVMVDIDHFKQINDTYGHLTGDAVLRQVAGRLRGSVRPYDIVGRFGGEEFLVVFPGCRADQGVRQAERLRAEMCAEPVQIRDSSIPVTISLGVLEVSDKETVGMESLLGTVDAALYRAKAGGRNRVELAMRPLESPPGAREPADTLPGQKG
jgi:diguanylate cyclase (GGDEF)-like protein